MLSTLVTSLLAATSVLTGVNAVTIDASSQSSLTNGSYQTVKGIMNYYHGDDIGETPGLFPAPAYWWESGAAWNTLIEYYAYTGDDRWNNQTMKSLLFQVGPDDDYMPLNQTTSEGNDDHGFWGIAAMSAAENNFPNPASDEPQWLALAQATFNRMASRWDDENCNGGLRWQIFQFNNGYKYKNSISNGVFFNLAARLARYTGNQTYADWAQKTWDWTVDIGLINKTNHWAIYDGANVPNCTTDTFDTIQWTYNNGMYLGGAAFMYNYTNGNSTWKSHTQSLLDSAQLFFFVNSTVLYEPACEPSATCDYDQTSFKGYLSQQLNYAAKVAPFTADQVHTLLASSAEAAGLSCSGGTDGITCGNRWYEYTWDGDYGLGEQISAADVVLASLSRFAPEYPVTANTGGTSAGDPSAGTNDDSSTSAATSTTASTKDKALGGLLTVVLSLGVLAGGGWLAI
ncbi:6-phosphofructokinase, alpha subunit [Saitoella coloradoensis]